MELAKVLRPVFAVAICGVIYIIIILALRIMYKDVKNGDKRRVLKKAFGLEIINSGDNPNLKKGGIVPIRGNLTIGRKEDNMVIINDPYVSSYHAKIYVKNTDYLLEDLGSTNGTLLNEEKLEGKAYLNPGDEIEIGSVLFRVIG
jgi:pSer/pThr/pTyr-binding forkhead associated (FHA) protein